MARTTRSGPQGDKVSPEGPYEAGAGDAAPPAPDLRYTDEALRILDLVALLGPEADRRLGVEVRELGLVAALVRDHVTGRLTTMSSLAQASGLPYATAHRAIARRLADGRIVRRERTSTGRSHSLHPSEELLAGWSGFARSLRDHIDPARPRPPRRGRKPAPVGIPPLAPLGRKLALPRGLRGLVHADPTFMTMHALKRHFEVTLGVDLTRRPPGLGA